MYYANFSQKIRHFEVLLEATGYIREVPPESGELSESWLEQIQGHRDVDEYPPEN